MWWRCLRIEGVMSSVERVDPPPGAKEVCFDTVKGGVSGHACFLQADTIEQALARSRGLHPSKDVS